MHEHIQWNYHALLWDSYHDNINKQLGKGIIPSCKSHVVEEETFGGGPKGGGKEKLGEKKWVSLNTLSLRKTKIWQDYSTSLELKRGEEMGFLCALEWRRGGLYSNDRENMNEMSFNESWQRIMNLDLILVLGEIWCIKWKDWW